MGYDVVTFGEVMIRLTPPGNQRLEQATSLEMTAGGAEMNTAVGLSRFGLRVAWVSRLPANPLGRYIASQARQHGVATEHILWAAGEGERAGLYFLEEGAAPRPSAVLYDRADSAIARLDPDELDWEPILRGSRVFHVTGITPALGPGCAEATWRGLRAARATGCLTSFDPNYRSRLWGVAAARATYQELVPLVDVLFCSPADLRQFLDIDASDPEQAARAVQRRYGCRAVAITMRQATSVRDNRVQSLVVAGQAHLERERGVEIVDRLGAGDAYVAGFWYGYLTAGTQDESAWARAAAYGAAAGALKHSIRGDLPILTVEELEAEIASGGGGTRLQR